MTSPSYGGWSRGFRSGGFNQIRRRRGGRREWHRRRERPVRSRGRRHLGSRLQGAVPRSAPHHGAEPVLHRSRRTGTSSCSWRPTPRRTSATSTRTTRAPSSRSARKVTDNLELFAQRTATPTARSPAWKTRASSATRRRWYRRPDVQPRRAVASAAAAALNWRSSAADYQHIGETYWEPYNVTSRDSDRSASTCASDSRATSGRSRPGRRTSTDEKYNAEFSPGGFLFQRAAHSLRRGIHVIRF